MRDGRKFLTQRKKYIIHDFCEAMNIKGTFSLAALNLFTCYSTSVNADFSNFTNFKKVKKLEIRIANKLSILTDIQNMKWPMWTVEPSDTFILSSIPSNLVNEIYDGNVLKFGFGSQTFVEAEKMGVRVQIPPNDLETVVVGDSQLVQILPGKSI